MIKKKPVDPAIPPFTIVVAEWEDVYANASNQFETISSALESHTPMIRRSVGFYVGEKDGIVMMATDDDRVTNAKEAIGGLMYIPKMLLKSPLKVIGALKIKYK